MARGTKVRDAVIVEPLRGKRLRGTVISIDAQNLRCVATDEGYVYAAPDEMERGDHDPQVKAVEDLEPGDVVVLFNGMRRTVDLVVPTGTPTRYRVIFREEDKPLTIFREQQAEPGALYRVVSPGDAAPE